MAQRQEYQKCKTCKSSACKCKTDCSAVSTLLEIKKHDLNHIYSSISRELILNFIYVLNLNSSKFVGRAENFGDDGSILVHNLVGKESLAVQVNPSNFKLNKTFHRYALDNPDLMNVLHANDFKLFNLYECYFSLLRDHLKLRNENENLNIQIRDLENTCVLKSCNACIDLKVELQKVQEENNVLAKDCLLSKKEKDKMVIKYATSERQVIESQKLAKISEKKLLDISKENALMQRKVIKAQDDLSKKCIELTQLKTQLEQVKDEVNLKGVKLKWAQNKLSCTTDLQQETQTKLNESLAKIVELTKEWEKLKNEALEYQKKYQKVEENAISDQQIKEQQAKLILDRHLMEESENERARLKKEVEVLTEKQMTMKLENEALTLQIYSTEKELNSIKLNLENLNDLSEKQLQEIDKLKQESLQIEVLNEEVKSKEIQINSLENEIQELILEKKDLTNDLETFREREPEVLKKNKSLSDELQSFKLDFAELQTEHQILKSNFEPIQKSLNESINKIKNLESKLLQEQEQRSQDCESLAKYIAEQILQNENLFYKLEESKGETAIFKKKCDLTIRELMKELNICRSKLSINETKINKSDGSVTP